MPRTLLFCGLDLQFQGHWWSLKGQILAIFSHFGPVLLYRKLDHHMAGIYIYYIYMSSVSMKKYLIEAIFGLCVERFHRYCSNEKNSIASLLKFPGYIHSHKILPGNIFGRILKNKMAATRVFCQS